jgi:hypothetical protein
MTYGLSTCGVGGDGFFDLVQIELDKAAKDG